MNTKNVWKWGFALLFALVLASCSFVPDNTGKADTIPEMNDQRDFLAALKAMGNYKIDEAELEKQILQLINPETVGRSITPNEKTVITGSRKLPISEQRIANRSFYARSVAGEQEPVDIYEFTTENPNSGKPGYVLASNDMRIGNILAVIDGGTLEDEEEWFSDIIFSGIANHIDYTLDLYDSISDEEVRDVLETFVPLPVAGRALAVSASGSDSYTASGKGLIHYWYPDAPLVQSVWYSWTGGYEPRVPVAWNQWYPYNYVVRRSFNSTAWNDYVTGCGPTALSQLMAYHGRPAKCTWNETVPNLNVNYNNRIYNWADMRLVSGSYADPYTSAEWDIAVLMYEIGMRSTPRANYKKRTTDKDGNVTGPSTGTPPSAMITALKQMGYNNTTPSAFSPYNLNVVRDSLALDLPVIMYGFSDASSGHSWIVDGIRKMTYAEYLTKTYTRVSDGVTSRSWVWTDRDFVHCNAGWQSKRENAWYLSSIFYMRDDYISHARNNKPYYYQYNLQILPYIY